MKSLLLISLIAVSHVTHVPYRELTYADFKGHGPSAAHTSTNIDLIETEDNGKHRFYVDCYFVPGESWINVKTPEVLFHEQLHFRISYNIAQGLQKTFERFQDCDSLTAIVLRSLYNEQIEAWKKQQRDFDESTNHGIDTTAQRTWQLRINQELKN